MLGGLPHSRWRLYYIVIGLALACTQAERSTAPPEETTTPSQPATTATATAEPAPARFSGQFAYRHVEQLASVIGSRPTGTAKEAEAAEYIAAQFSKYGYNVEKQPFDFDTYRVR